MAVLARTGAAALVALAIVLSPAGIRHAGACSCIFRRAAILTPDRADGVPVNTRVRLELSPRRGGGRPRIVLRPHGGAEVSAAQRAFSSGALTVVELVPSIPLAADTQYEVALIDADAHPSTLVVGTFRTGTAADTTAPAFDRAGSATVYKNAMSGGGDCTVPGPWIEIDGLAASDPSRASAQLLWAVWRADARGTIDTTAPPETILGAERGTLFLGNHSMCDPHDFALPSGRVTVGVAPLDEAGNAGAVRKFTVDVAAARVAQHRR